MNRKYCFLFFFCFTLFFSFAEDNLGFGFDDEQTSEDSAFSVKLAGEFHAGGVFLFKKLRNLKHYSPDLPVWGNVNITAKAPLTEVYFGTSISGKTIPMGLGQRFLTAPKPVIPAWIEQAYVQVNAGPLLLGGGLKKMTWGKADLMSVLDVLNPMDYTSREELNPEKIKIAQPMFYFSAYIPFDMKVDVVFLPLFEPNRISLSGDWKAFELTDSIPFDFFSEDEKNVFAENFKNKLDSAETTTIRYFQTGMRYSATFAGRHDVSLQYFTGMLPKPAMKAATLSESDSSFIADEIKKSANGEVWKKNEVKAIIKNLITASQIVYNRYHQIGVDYGSSFGPVNVRAEFAANITEDIKGSIPYVYNPFIAWNIGFDYTMPYNINLNVQVVENIILLTKNILKNDMMNSDIEKNMKITDTHFSFVLSQKLIRGSFEWRIAALVGVEDSDFMIMPGVNWLFGTVLMNADFAFFGGNKAGKFGRFGDNHFIKLSVGYKF